MRYGRTSSVLTTERVRNYHPELPDNITDLEPIQVFFRNLLHDDI